ncbi:MAG: DUF3310 domain-containing protein [Synergistaceae bacterium]|nr:DUF3310 domain-containing protein [Synergistaceae bacterium]
MKEQTHPDYYKTDTGLEAIDVIDALGLGQGFALGNAIKYIFRAGKKSEESVQDDIKKAIWYLEHFIDLCNRLETNHDQKNAQNELLVCKS